MVIYKLFCGVVERILFFPGHVGVKISQNRRIFCTRDVLRSPYSNENKIFILKKINEKDLPSTIGAANANKILNHIGEGKLNSLEDLLRVNGIGPKLLQRICDKILDIKTGVDSKHACYRKKKEVDFVTPHLDEREKRAIVTIVGIHIGLENISWAVINCVSKTILEWSAAAKPTEHHIYDLLQLVDRTIRLIPLGDIYLLEDGGIGRQRHELVRSHLTAMFITALQLTRGNEKVGGRVTLVKTSLKNKLYHGCVGSERVSLQHHCAELLDNGEVVPANSDLRHDYFRRSPLSREDMAQALLLTNSFIKVVLKSHTMPV